MRPGATTLPALVGAAVAGDGRQPRARRGNAALLPWLLLAMPRAARAMIGFCDGRAGVQPGAVGWWKKRGAQRSARVAPGQKEPSDLSQLVLHDVEIEADVADWADGFFQGGGGVRVKPVDLLELDSHTGVLRAGSAWLGALTGGGLMQAHTERLPAPIARHHGGLMGRALGSLRGLGSKLEDAVLGKDADGTEDEEPAAAPAPAPGGLGKLRGAFLFARLKAGGASVVAPEPVNPKGAKRPKPKRSSLLASLKPTQQNEVNVKKAYSAGPAPTSGTLGMRTASDFLPKATRPTAAVPKAPAAALPARMQREGSAGAAGAGAGGWSTQVPPAAQLDLTGSGPEAWLAARTAEHQEGPGRGGRSRVAMEEEDEG